MDRYAAVASYLHQAQVPVVLLGGRSERELKVGRELQAMAGVPLLDLVGKTSLEQLFACLARCRLLLAPDTGAVHIANAFGRPVVGLYAVAPASRTGPYGHLEHSVDVFEEAVHKLLGKDPKTISWSQRVHDPRAMELISVTAVLAKIKNLLNNC